MKAKTHISDVFAVLFSLVSTAETCLNPWGPIKNQYQVQVR